jgi:hypothetical protein
LDICQAFPEADILVEVIDTEIINRNVRDPVGISKGILDSSIFPLGSLEDKGGQVFRVRRGAKKKTRKRP